MTKKNTVRAGESVPDAKSIATASTVDFDRAVAYSVPRTPGPWACAHRESRDGMWNTEVFAGDDVIATLAWVPVHYRGVIRTSRQANAEFIVRACNSHDELLAALKGLMADIDSGLLVRDISRDSEAGFTVRMLGFVQRLAAAQLAIAKAEGH